MQNLYLSPFKLNKGFSVKGNGVRHALYKLLSQPLSDEVLLEEIKTLHKQMRKQTNTIVVRVLGQVVLINLSDVLYLKAAGAYSKIVTANRSYLISKTLKVLRPTLPDTFIRVHRSFLVPIEQIDSFRLNVLTLKSGETIHLSKKGRQEIAQHLDVS